MKLFTKISELGDEQQKLISYGLGNVFFQQAVKAIIEDMSKELQNLTGTYEEIGKRHKEIKIEIDVWDDILQASMHMAHKQAIQLEE